MGCNMVQLGKRIILFQKSASGRSFQFGKYYFTIYKPSLWIVKPNWPFRVRYELRIWTGIKVERE
uniref:Uncharacterized protein n=1 Tax=Klebsiella phage vB_Kpn2-P2 TaxID=3230849 RepID=A0AAU8EEJ2_9VIRU